MHTLVMCGRRQDKWSIASEVGINFGAVKSILTNILGMSKVSARWVPWMLSDDQKKTRGHLFDPESKIQSKQWKHPGSPHPKKFKRVHSAGKVAWLFWDIQGMIMIEYLEQGCTINGAYYIGELRWLGQKNHKIEARKTDLQSSTLAGKCPCCLVTSCHGCCDWIWIWNRSSSPLFSWYGFFWLLSVPKTEIPFLWYTVLKQWRHHRGSKRVLGGTRKGLLFWRDKKVVEIDIKPCKTKTSLIRQKT